MSNSNPSLSGRRSIDYGIVAKQDSSAADGPFSPAGLKVLVVDDDPMCLKVVSAMLKRCNYEVVTQSNGHEALEMLRERQEDGIDQFDLVLSDVYMPDMDGFRLLEAIGLELELPVIMMSSDGDTNVVLRGVTHGAVDFLIKPVRIEELRNVWQHVVRRRSVQISRNGDDSAVDYDGDSRTHGTKRKETDTLRAEHESLSGSKKARVVWSVEMHQQFVSAVNILGIDKAVPKRILDLMNVEGLTRENVASHLQKYRLYLKRVEGVSNGRVGRIPKPPVVERMSAQEGEGGMSFGTSQQSLSQQHNNSPMMQQSLGVQQQQQQHSTSMAQSMQPAQQAVPMSMMPSGYGPPAMMGMAGPMAAAHMAAAWQQQQQTMAMQAAAAAAAASGALPGPSMPPMHHSYMSNGAPMMAAPEYHHSTMQHASISAPYCPPQPPTTSALTPTGPQSMPPVSRALYSTYPGSHGSLATLPYQQHAVSGTAAGAVANGAGALKIGGGHIGGGGHNHHNGCSSTEGPAILSHSPPHLPPTALPDDVVAVVDHYHSNDDDALLPSLGEGGVMPEDEPLSESLLHDLPPIKHEGDQEFFSIFNIQQAGDRAAAGP